MQEIDLFQGNNVIKRFEVRVVFLCKTQLEG